MRLLTVRYVAGGKKVTEHLSRKESYRKVVRTKGSSCQRARCRAAFTGSIHLMFQRSFRSAIHLLERPLRSSLTILARRRISATISGVGEPCRTHRDESLPASLS